jgi:hypothetical protein
MASTKNFAMASTSSARYAMCLIFAIGFSLSLLPVVFFLASVIKRRRCQARDLIARVCGSCPQHDHEHEKRAQFRRAQRSMQPFS